MLGTRLSTPPVEPSSGARTAALIRLDLREEAEVTRTVAAFRPDTIAHLAAVSRVDEAARGEESAREVNVAGTGHVLRAAEAVGARLLLLSTDSVFDGTAGPYAEDAPAAPVNVYGRTKAAAERSVRAGGPRHLIVRTSLVYGWPGPGQHPNFVTETIGRLRRGDRVLAYTDMLRSPVRAGDLAGMLARTLERGISGVCHLSGRDTASMHDFALAIAEVFGLDPGLIAAGLAPPQFGEQARPRALGLTSARAERELGLRLPGLREGLERMREEGAAALS